MNPIVIRLMLLGAAATTSGFNNVGNSAQGAGQKITTAGRAAASAWSPAIAAAKQYDAQLKALESRKMPVNGQDAASAWSPYISAVKSADAAQKQLSQNARDIAQRQMPANGRAAASAWSPYIAAIKQAEAEQKKLADAQKQLTQRATPVNGSGAASAWSPAIAAARQYDAQLKSIAQRKIPVNGAGAASAWSPAISAAKQYAAEQKRIEAEALRFPNAMRGAAGAARDMWSTFRSGAKASEEQVDHLLSKLKTLDKSVGQTRFENLNDKLGMVRNVGLGIGAAGAVGAIGLGKSLENAGDMQRMRSGLAISLGRDPKAADGLIEDLKKFDRQSPFNFKDSVSGAQRMLAMGFKREEIIPTMTTLGDAVAAGGGTQEELNNAIVAFSQIRTLGKVEMDELRQLAEGGRMPVFEILKEKIGQQRLSNIMGGKEKMSADEAIPLLLQGLKERTGGAMQDANNTLPGVISNLNSALWQLGETIGKYLIPPAMFFVRIATGIVDFFNALPAPIQAIIAYGAAVVTGLLIVGGALLVVLATAGQAVIGLGALGFSVGGVGVASTTAAGGAATLSGTLMGRLVPAMMTMGATAGVIALKMALVAVAAAALIYGLDKLLHWKEDKALAENIAAGDATDPKRLEISNKMRAKRGLAPETLAQFKAREANDTDMNGNYVGDPSQSSGDPQLDAIQKQIAQMNASSMNASYTPAMTPGMSGVAAGGSVGVGPGTQSFNGMGIVPSYSGSGGADSIEMLEDEVARSSKSYNASSPRERLRLARRADRHRKEDERERKAETRAQERERKKQERAAERERKKVEREAAKQAKAQAKYDDLVEAFGGDAGDANVSLAMPMARKVFGARDEEAKARFNKMNALFGQKGGFQSEAEREAARKVLSGKQKKPGKYDFALAYLRAGGSLEGMDNALERKATPGGDFGGFGASGFGSSGFGSSGVDSFGTFGLPSSGKGTSTRGGGNEYFAEVESMRDEGAVTIVKFRDLRISKSDVFSNELNKVLQ